MGAPGDGTMVTGEDDKSERDGTISRDGRERKRMSQ